MNKIYFLASFLVCIYSCSSIKPAKDNISIEWEYSGADSISLMKGDEVLVPGMPVGETKQLHLNGFSKGKYKVVVYDNSQVVELKTFSLR